MHLKDALLFVLEEGERTLRRGGPQAHIDQYTALLVPWGPTIEAARAYVIEHGAQCTPCYKRASELGEVYAYVTGIFAKCDPLDVLPLHDPNLKPILDRIHHGV